MSNLKEAMIHAVYMTNMNILKWEKLKADKFKVHTESVSALFRNWVFRLAKDYWTSEKVNRLRSRIIFQIDNDPIRKTIERVTIVNTQDWSSPYTAGIIKDLCEIFDNINYSELAIKAREEYKLSQQPNEEQELKANLQAHINRLKDFKIG